MKRHLAWALILLAACTPQSKQITEPSNAITATKQSKEDLIAKLKQQGVFDSVQTSKIDGNFEVVSTKVGDDYFVKDGVVVSSSRLARKNEQTLIYWRYRFKGKPYHESKVNEMGSLGHGQAMLQLQCDSLGIGVVYQPSNEKVTRVFYYEAK